MLRARPWLWRRCLMDMTELDDHVRATTGVFTLAMLHELGYSRRQLRRWVERRWVVRVGGRAFVRSGTAITVRHRAIAAHLTWPDAIVCFRTAAILHGFPLEDDGVTHVLVPDNRRPMRGMRLHRWSVRPTEIVLGDSMRLTDRVTTLADCLGRLPDVEAWGLLAWMWTRDMVTEDELSAQLNDRSHLYGVVRLRLMVTAVRRGALSVGEIRLQEFLEHYVVTGWTGDFFVWKNRRVVARGDIGFRERRLIIEFDGRIAHNETTRAEDEKRDRTINRAGYDVLHVTWAMLHERPHRLLKNIRAMLAAPPRSERRRELAEAAETAVDNSYPGARTARKAS